MVRVIYILTLSFFFAIGGYSQVMQTTGGAGGNKFRALKADSFLVVPSGTDTANLANPKYGEGTTGAIFVKTADSTLWFKVGGKWVQAGGTGGGGGGTITNISFRAGTVVDTLYFTDSGGDTDFYYVVVKDGLISGGVVTYTGFARTYAISAALFRKNGQFYTTNDTTITIAALSNPDSSRSDVFVVNTSGQATTLTGVESANPLTPQIDPDTEVYLTHVTLSPSAPSAGIDTTVIYDENTEWVGGASGVTVNFAGTTTPYRGTKVTDVSAINSGDIIGYGTGTAVNRTSYAGISLFLKLKATMPNNNNILVSFFNGNTQVSSEVALPITKSSTTSYQGLSLGFDAFSFTNNLFDSVRFRYSGSGITGLYLDFIYLQNGMAPVVINPGTDFVQNIRRTGDNIEQQKNGVWTPVIDISDKKSGTVTSVATNTATGITGGTITTSGTLAIDTTIISTRAWRDKLADSLGAIIATKGTGTVTNFSAGDLSPLFTTSEATTTTTPALSFSLSNAGSYTVFGNQTNASAAPSFAKLNINTIDATGTPSATTYLRGDGSWASAGGGGVPIDSVVIRWNSLASSYYSFNGGYGGTSATRRNYLIGENTGRFVTSGQNNFALGYAALDSTTTGRDNFAIGTDALKKNKSGSYNVAIGTEALRALDGGTRNDNHVAIGYRALYNSTIPTAGGNADANVAVGPSALYSVTTGNNNTAIGALAGYTHTGSHLTAIGSGAARYSTGSFQTAIGSQALGTTSQTGSSNTAVGYYALGVLQGGNNNTAVGDRAFQTLVSNSGNTGIGYLAGNGVTGGQNTALGESALSISSAAVVGNTAVGYRVNNNGLSGTASYNIGIGHSVNNISSTGSNQFVLGSNSVRWAASQVNGTVTTLRQWVFAGSTTNITGFTNSVAFDIPSTVGGLRIPIMTQAQRNALTATDGLQVYCSDCLDSGGVNAGVLQIYQASSATWKNAF